MMALCQPPPVRKQLTSQSAAGLMGLSITQTVVGALCFLMGIILIPLDNNKFGMGSGIAVYGYGIWIGLLFIMLGIIGVAAARTDRRDLITGALVLNIIYPPTVCIVLLSLTSAGINGTSKNNCQITHTTYTAYISDVFWAFDSLMLVLDLIVAVVCIVSSCICCSAVCGPQTTSTVSPARTRPQQSTQSTPGPFVVTPSVLHERATPSSSRGRAALPPIQYSPSSEPPRYSSLY